MDSKEVDDSQDEFEDEVGKVKVSRGKTHDFLGMILDFSTPGKVKVNVVECIKKMIEDFPEDDDTTAITPAALHLFNVREDGEKLPEDEAVSFHNVVARGSFVCERARPDIQPAVAFLTTCASQPDEDDWKKLCRVINCLKGTPNRILTPSADGAWAPKWHVDVSCAVHKDMRMHDAGKRISSHCQFETED